MPNIYDYTDYRAYLKDYYTERKECCPSFSYQVLARKGGLKNRGFLHSVVNRRKNLSAASAARLGKAVTENARGAEYFELMVAFCRAGSQSEKERLLCRLNAFKSGKTGARRVRELRQDQFEFYGTWYHATVRALLAMRPFTDDYVWLARAVYPEISPHQARDSVALLERLGLVGRDDDGRCVVLDKVIRPDGAISGVAVRKLHREQGGLGLEALGALPADQRHVTGLTLGISRESYHRVCSEILDLQERLLAMAEADPHPDTVYQLNFQVFPQSITLDSED